MECSGVDNDSWLAEFSSSQESWMQPVLRINNGT